MHSLRGPKYVSHVFIIIYMFRLVSRLAIKVLDIDMRIYMLACSQKDISRWRITNDEPSCSIRTFRGLSTLHDQVNRLLTKHVSVATMRTLASQLGPRPWISMKLPMSCGEGRPTGR